MASIPFLLASIHHRTVNGLITLQEARQERQAILVRENTGHQPAPLPEVKKWSFGSAEYEVRGSKPGPDATGRIPDPNGSLYTNWGGDLRHYGDGLIPEENDDLRWEEQEYGDRSLVTELKDDEGESYGTRFQLSQLWYLHRDEVEVWNEKRKQREGDLTTVIGASYSAGAEGSKEWLDEQLAQMRIEYAAKKLQARRFWWNKRRSLPKSFRTIHDDPQLKWLTRRAELMRIRFNVRRHLEALGRFDVSRYPLTLANAPAWDRVVRNAAADRQAKLTLYGPEWLPREYIHPTGLITTNPKRRAA